MTFPCDGFCDGPTSRLMDQSVGRYNDRSAFSNNMAMDSSVHMHMQFLAQAQNTLEQHGLANTLLQLRAIQGQPGGV